MILAIFPEKYSLRFFGGFFLEHKWGGGGSKKSAWLTKGGGVKNTNMTPTIEVSWLGVKIRKLKVDFKTGGIWHCVGNEH